MSQPNYGLLDSNAPSKIATSPIEGVQNMYARQIQNQANQLSMLKVADDIRNKNALNKAYKESFDSKTGNVDFSKLRSNLAMAGLGSHISDLEKSMASTREATAKADLAQRDVQREKFADLAFNPSDENALAHLQDSILKGELTVQQAQSLWANVSHMNPSERKSFFTEMGTKAEERFKQQEMSRHNQVTEGIQQGHLDVSRASQLESQRHNMAGEDLQVRSIDPEFQKNLAQAKASGSEVGKASAQASIRLPNVVSSTQDVIRKINELIGSPEERDETGKVIRKATKAHPGFETSVGATLVPGERFIPGSPAADFAARMNELQGHAFLQAIDSLRGTGSISEKEGEKATEAVTRMSTMQSEKEFIKAAREFQNILRRGVENTKKISESGSKNNQGSQTSVIHFHELQ